MRGTVVPTATTLGLGQQRWPKVGSGDTLLLVPVGSVEQHGPHLPLATDSMIANAVTRAAAERLDATGTRVLVAPSVNYGASGEHEGFPGTISIGHEALFLLLTEFGRSASRWAGGVIFVNGHGGNTATLTKVVDLLRYEGRAVAWTSTALPDADAHAGETEAGGHPGRGPAAGRVPRAAERRGAGGGRQPQLAGLRRGARERAGGQLAGGVPLPVGDLPGRVRGLRGPGRGGGGAADEQGGDHQGRRDGDAQGEVRHPETIPGRVTP